MPESINIEPDWDSMRAWLRLVAKSDLPNAIRINEEMGREGIPASELVELWEVANPQGEVS